MTVRELVKHSFMSGVVPTDFKHAVIKPMVKKPALDPTILPNYLFFPNFLKRWFTAN